MKHKYALYQEMRIKAHPGWTGKIIFIDLYGGKDQQPKYLLNCMPGALAYYTWCVHPDGYGTEKVIAANWFEETEIEDINENP